MAKRNVVIQPRRKAPKKKSTKKSDEAKIGLDLFPQPGYRPTAVRPS